MSDYHSAPRQQAPQQQAPQHAQTPQPPQYAQYPQYAQPQAPQPGSPYPPSGAGMPYGPYAPQPGYMPIEQPWNTLSIVGFILAFVAAPAGLIVSIIAVAQINRTRERGRGLAVAGIAIGATLTLIAVLAAILLFWMIGEIVSNPAMFYDYGDYGYGDSMTPEDLQDAMEQFTAAMTSFAAAR